MKFLHGMKMKREVTHGGIVPSGWQMAWYEPRRRLGVYFPRPLHWLLRAIREVIYRVRLAVHAPSLECTQVFDMQRRHRERQRLAEEYARGYMLGWRECFRSCLDVVEDEIAGASEVYDVTGWFTSGPDSPKEN
ncbi:MAG TPA: hypothetical protein VMJ13_02805 [Candidatus Acidoferrum sp.]|nr:hypothetical protein [Candidatus Acidoferrum sp.]